jgi:adenylosuccinate lyase
VLRNIGVPVAHTILAVQSATKGIGKLVLNQPALQADLDSNWAVVAEAIQTILRRENYPKPYEALKELTRGKAAIDKTAIQQFVKKLKVSAAIKKELRAISPQNYTGI